MHEGADAMSAPSSRPGPDAALDADVDERRAYHRRARQRSLLIATLSTVVVISLVVILVPRAPGWDRVRKSFFDGHRFREDFPELLGYLWVDVKLFLWCAPCILVWGLVIAMCRNTRNPVLFPVRLFAAAYTDVFRGVPIILTIYIIGFGVPGLGLDRPWNSPYLWGPVALVLAYSAYVAEVFRAGIESIHESQRAAARSLGLRHGQTMRFVVLPQAARRVIPPLMNDFLSLQKDVALVSLIGPIEVFRRANSRKDLYANFTPLVVAAVIFLAMTIPLTRLVDWYIHRQQRRIGGSVMQ